MARAAVGLSMQNDNELLKLFKELDQRVRFKVSDKAVSEGAKPVLAVMRSIVPDSRKTNSRAKQSEKTRSKWSGSRPLHTTLRRVIRKGQYGAKAFIGPSYSDGGGHGNLFSKPHKRTVYWGRDGASDVALGGIGNAGATRLVNQFVKRSADVAGPVATRRAIDAVKRELAKGFAGG